jgi:hypothetical protein
MRIGEAPQNGRLNHFDQGRSCPFRGASVTLLGEWELPRCTIRPSYVAVHDDKRAQTCFICAVREDTAPASHLAKRVGESRREERPGRNETKKAVERGFKRSAKIKKNKNFQAGQPAFFFALQPAGSVRSAVQSR